MLAVNVSTYAYLHGWFDYNTMHLAPLGFAVQAHEVTTWKKTWAEHSIDRWFFDTLGGFLTLHQNITELMQYTSKRQSRMELQHSVLQMQKYIPAHCHTNRCHCGRMPRSSKALARKKMNYWAGKHRCTLTNRKGYELRHSQWRKHQWSLLTIQIQGLTKKEYHWSKIVP